MTYPSFLSEHTCKFFLIPALTDILKKEYKHVIPIYPWLHREGSNLSQYIHADDKFRVLGLYARRPKINFTKNKILIKINPELVEISSIAINSKIPMIAGCPLSIDFWGLGDELNIFWLKITNNSKGFYEVPIEEKFNYNISSDDENVFKNSFDIVDYIKANTSLFDIQSLFDVIRYIKYNTRQGHSFFGANYKPIYFLLRD